MAYEEYKHSRRPPVGKPADVILQIHESDIPDVKLDSPAGAGAAAADKKKRKWKAAVTAVRFTKPKDSPNNSKSMETVEPTMIEEDKEEDSGTITESLADLKLWNRLSRVTGSFNTLTGRLYGQLSWHHLTLPAVQMHMDEVDYFDDEDEDYMHTKGETYDELLGYRMTPKQRDTDKMLGHKPVLFKSNSPGVYDRQSTLLRSISCEKPNLKIVFNGKRITEEPYFLQGSHVLHLPPLPVISNDSGSFHQDSVGYKQNSQSSWIDI